MMSVLLVDSSKVFPSVLERQLKAEGQFLVRRAQSLDEVEAVLAERRTGATRVGALQHPSVAVSSLVLPGAENGECVDRLIGEKIPVVVVSSKDDDSTREFVGGRDILDSFAKDSPATADEVVRLVIRLNRNATRSALVVDDSISTRTLLCRELKRQFFTVLEASTPEEALAILANTPDIRLLISDYEMPQMNGATFIRKVRQKHRKEDLAILGILAHEQGTLSGKLLKSGASDFLRKPFSREELAYRVAQSLDMLDAIEQARAAANRDYLTGLSNRRHFYELATLMLENASRQKVMMALAMFDVDHFKKVNDTHGHAAGDLVLQGVAQILGSASRRADIVARLGGEEFCIVGLVSGPDEALRFFERVRTKVAQTPLPIGDQSLPITVSIGVATTPATDLDALLRVADERLYRAKREGRNRVVGS